MKQEERRKLLPVPWRGLSFFFFSYIYTLLSLSLSVLHMIKRNRSRLQPAWNSIRHQSAEDINTSPSSIRRTGIIRLAPPLSLLSTDRTPVDRDISPDQQVNLFLLWRFLACLARLRSSKNEDDQINGYWSSQLSIQSAWTLRTWKFVELPRRRGAATSTVTRIIIIIPPTKI